ncbi:hypothetical protein [Sediminicurvatus halobius]|uniref:Uncharacterized protein n=1 Tax=Sediminicurvatus halobius TaxID=2182432 RepID=A0A2U2N131_9GAMM|nr:hypothetical protein [Spiribacter halobius]PWG62820.1 hypothetical protein DEM34_10660 [Spiribacter halobius]UEX77031.1 hypothetical protein LMH63_13895 [Spiribacter halobius]
MDSLGFGDPDVRADLKDMCCPPMQFMWDNHLLAPRVEWEVASGPRQALHMCFLKGFRVVRAFFFFARDQALYECPFCRAQFVRPLGYRDVEARRGEAVSIQALPRGPLGYDPVLNIPRRVLQEALLETKRRAKTWPPRD